MAGATERPYFKHSIAELEARFSEFRDDLSALQAVERELAHRKSDRAARLRAKVASVLERTTSAAPSRRVVAAKIERMSPAAPEAGGDRAEPVSPFSRQGHKTFARDSADGLLGAWTALEALSPQTYVRPEDLAGGDRTCVVDLAREVPWAKGERSRPNRQLHYRIIVGAIPMERATTSLVQAFGADEERGSRPREKAALAEFLVDRQGVLVEENAVAVSSFGWALPQALEGKLGALGTWPEVERDTVSRLEGLLRKVDDDGKPVPLTAAAIRGAFDWLAREFQIPQDLVEPPSFVLRLFHYYRAANPPEASLLNSFYLGDLSVAAGLNARGAVPKGLRSYLGIDPPAQPIDLFNDRPAVERAVAPHHIPLVRWPSPGGHPLVLLQQCAVNLARSSMDDEGGLVAVNGPPGTGKTTLLRDVVAGALLDRAMAMIEFDDPADAFQTTGARHSAGGKAFFHLYRLDPSIRGHEILVASSNNKAVENVSGELPGARAIGRTLDELSYFRSVSDFVHGQPMRSGQDDLNDTQAGSDSIASGETWGLIAAVLGNAGNRAAFRQRFWWDEELGFRLYLKAARGDSVVKEIRDPETGGIVERRNPRIVTSERPPSPAQARVNWRQACRRLRELESEVADDLAKLETVRKAGFTLATARTNDAKLAIAVRQADAQRDNVANRHREQSEALARAAAYSTLCKARIAEHLGLKPGFFSRLFRTARWTAWHIDHRKMVSRDRQATARLREAEEAVSKLAATLKSMDAQVTQVRGKLAANRATIKSLEEKIETWRVRLDGRLVDDAFFDRGHESSNLSAPWVPDSIHRKREALFAASLDIHKAFIDGAAQKMLHNLSVLMDTFSNGPPKDPAKLALLPELWSTLFLVVPVLSTTFASVERMIGALPPNAIGWLLIDEAGQALPQAAVGAISRARRSIIVGDPLQIPPVVTLPERLTVEICKYFNIDGGRWAAPTASAQTLADGASAYQATFPSQQGARQVGIPLLVHRRCEQPMFGISNHIAYDNKMVLATVQGQSRIGEVLGPSGWVSVEGEADTKWCPREGDLTRSMLRRLADAGIEQPDIFIISPFRIVAQELRRGLSQDTELMHALGVDARSWANDRVGTIHTVQGREAEAVILVLGAPRADQGGARNWAGGTPNIFNVAVSRAKRRFYVVGSHGAWSGVGHASALADRLHKRA